MKRKMKLTDLRQVETSKEEMGFVKGGNEEGPPCSGACGCGCYCQNSQLTSDQNYENLRNSDRNGTVTSKIGDVIIGLAASAAM